MTEYQAHGGRWVTRQRSVCGSHKHTHTHTHIRVYVNLKGVGRSCFFYTPLYMQSHVTASCSLTGTTHLENNTFPGPVSRFDQRVVSQLAVNSSCPPVALSFCLKSSPSLSSLESTVCLLLLIESSVFVTLVTFGAFLIRLHDK